MSRRPFIDDLFTGEGNTWLKILGCAAVTAVLVGERLFRAAVRDPDGIFTPGAIAAVLVGSAIVGGLIGLLLSLKDTVARRVAAGEPCHWLLRTLFGRGWVSLVIWFFIAFPLGIVVILALSAAGMGL